MSNNISRAIPRIGPHTSFALHWEEFIFLAVLDRQIWIKNVWLASHHCLLSSSVKVSQSLHRCLGVSYEHLSALHNAILSLCHNAWNAQRKVLLRNGTSLKSLRAQRVTVVLFLLLCNVELLLGLRYDNSPSLRPSLRTAHIHRVIATTENGCIIEILLLLLWCGERCHLNIQVGAGVAPLLAFNNGASVHSRVKSARA